MKAFPRPRPGKAYLAGSPLLIAHRGGAKLAPENTLEAFSSAIEDWGADMLELDVRTTRDNELVVIHDETVDRTCDGSGKVRDLPWTEIAAMDAGFHFIDPHGRRSFRGRGVRIPRFEEVLEALPATRLNVEAKDRWSAEALVRIIRRHAAEQRVLVAAEWEGNRRRVRAYSGPWGASRRHIAVFLLLVHTPLGPLFTPGCDVLQVPENHKGLRILTRKFIREAHKRNLPIHVWTVDDPDDMRRLLEWGVDGIQSDRPDLLAGVLTEHAGRPVAPCLRVDPDVGPPGGTVGGGLESGGDGR
jgi:glycerophosphoryl diester phosphodiesterase